MKQFSRNMLPILGVNFFYFASESEALAFARWAKRETRNSQHPCRTSVKVCEDYPAHERYEVKISNW